MTELETLLAIEAIKVLEARRVRAVDTQDWEAYAAVHVPEMEHTYGGGPPAYGIGAVVAKMRERLKGAVTAHHLCLPEIAFISDDEATGVWKMQDDVVWSGDPERRLKGSGYYHCRYVRREGSWLIAGRTLERIHLEESTVARPAAHARG